MQYINKIRELQKKKNLTLENVAKGIGMTRPGFTEMLNSGDMKVSTLRKIADFFEVDIVYFFEGESKKNTDVDKVFEVLKTYVKNQLKIK